MSMSIHLSLPLFSGGTLEIGTELTEEERATLIALCLDLAKESIKQDVGTHASEQDNSHEVV